MDYSLTVPKGLTLNDLREFVLNTHDVDGLYEIRVTSELKLDLNPSGGRLVRIVATPPV